LLLAHTDVTYAVVASRYFRQCGWDVLFVRSASEARRLAREVDPTVIVLDTEFRLESGWLTCAKLTDEHPCTKIILTTPNATARKRRFARFAGAADLVDVHAGVSCLVDAVCTAALRAVG
jgi:DNA-binding response OmpR family regulator